MNNEIKHSILSRVIFVHSKIDDAGLTANEFRVYCHLARRAGNGQAFPSVASISAVCRIHTDTVWAVLKTLGGRGMLRKISRPGGTNIYQLTEPEEWTTPDSMGTGKEGAPETEGWVPTGNGGVGGTGNGGVRRISHEGSPRKEIQRESGDKPQKPQFRPPTEKEWLDHCRSTHPTWRPRAASSAWAYYESIGWRTKAGPIKNWKAAARTCFGRARPNELESQAYATQTEIDDYNKDFD